MSQEIKDFFMEEASELFDNINSILLKSEEAGDISAQEIDSLFRDIHTLKGGAGSVEMVKFSAYTHHLENFMDMVRDAKIDLNGKIIDFIIDGVSMMQDILNEEYEDRLDEKEYQERLDWLTSQIDKFQNIEQSSQDDNSKGNIETVLGDNAGEIIDLFDRVEEALNSVEIGAVEPELIVDDLFRSIHTLKGSSQFLDLQYFPKYLHEIEALLDRARDKKLKYTKELNSFLLEELSVIRELIDSELNGELQEDRFLELLDNIAKKIENFDKYSAPIAFELFDESKEELEKEDGFKLFGEDGVVKDENSSQSVAFELFDEDDIEKKSQSTLENNSVQNNKTDAIKIQDIKNDKKPNTPDKKSDKQTKLSLNKAAASTSIRVNLEKIDQLMNRVGDLVITKSMLFQFAESIEDENLYKSIFDRLSSLDRDIRELQESVMSVRMVPMESVYSRLPKMVRDLAKKLDKKIKFEHLGDSVEIDKMMVEGLIDPLTHIIRNSLDHGIEKPDVRYKNGKPEIGQLTISAEQESGNIIISITDDGAGINIDRVVEKALENSAISEDELSRMSEQDKLMLIFNPGLSTAKEVSDVSGRGVGMDVVMSNINSLGGHIKVFSRLGKGTKIQIVLPLTLAILDGLNVLVGDKSFILPLNSIVESLQPKRGMIKHIGEDKREILMLRKEFIPIIRLYKFFGLQPNYENIEDGMLIIVKTASSKVALYVDDFLKQEQIVVKSIEKNYKKIKGIGAATIRGDGSIGLILDIVSIVNMQERGA